MVANPADRPIPCPGAPPPVKSPPRRLVIVGTGLLGGSCALAVRRAGLATRVVGVARRAATAAAAGALGCFDHIATDLSAALADGDDEPLVILATPLGTFDNLFAQLGRRGEAMTVSDVGSAKGSVCAAAERHLAPGQRFVGAHPMAGSEQQGPTAARADLFDGKPCILTPTPRTDAAALEHVERFWQALGMRTMRMEPTEHDRRTALISHLPHAAAVLLVQVAAELGGLDVASTGFRDTTRLASGSPAMRGDILTENREQVVAALDAFAQRIAALRDRLTGGDDAGLHAWLERSKAARDQWLAQRKDLST